MKKEGSLKRKRRKARTKRIIIAVGFIVVGICICIYPYLTESYYERKQQEILREWKMLNSLQQQTEAERENSTETGRKNGKDAGKNTEALGTYTEVVGEKDSHGVQNVQGILQIPSIELEQPILKDATDTNLKYSLCTIEPTGIPGKIGNYVIAGHKSRTQGKHFNRLHEVKVGDVVYVILKKETVQYEITDIQVIEPTDTWILESDGQSSILTLITCDYSENGVKKRLAVQGEKVE